MHYYRSGSAAAAMDAGFLDRPAVRNRLVGAELVHTTGITAAISTTAAALLDRLAALRDTLGFTLSVDLNWRPALWRDTDPAPLWRLLRAADVVLIGADEAMLFAGTSDPARLRELLGPRSTIVLKSDAHVALALEPDGRRTEVPALTVDVVEPVGAGDAFAAGYLAGTLQGLPMEQRLRLGHLMCSGRAGGARGSCGSTWTRSPAGTAELLRRGLGRDAGRSERHQFACTGWRCGVSQSLAQSPADPGQPGGGRPLARPARDRAGRAQDHSAAAAAHDGGRAVRPARRGAPVPVGLAPVLLGGCGPRAARSTGCCCAASAAVEPADRADGAPGGVRERAGHLHRQARQRAVGADVLAGRRARLPCTARLSARCCSRPSRSGSARPCWPAIEYHQFTPNTIAGPDELRDELDRVRAQGWAHDRAEHESFINCIGAPITERSGRVVGAVSVSVPDLLLNYEQVLELLPELLATTAAIGADYNN